MNGVNGAVIMRGSDRIVSAGSEALVPISATAGTFSDITIFGSPGKAGVVVQFPRLNVQSSLYSEYRWRGCTVRYRSFCGSGTAGRVALAATYDPDSDTQFTSIAEMLATVPHVTGSVWKDHSLNVPCSPSTFQKNWYPCAPDATIPGADQTVPFVVIVGTDQGTAAADVGYLEIDWVIEFKNPIDPAINPV